MHDLVLRTSVILAVAWVATRLMPRATAATRHLIWRGAITAVLVAPLVSPLAPRFEIFLPVVERVATAPQPAEVPANSESTASDDLSRAPQTKPISSIEVLWMLSILAWPTGAVLALLWFSIGWFASLVSVMRAHSSPSTWRLELNALRERLRIPHEVELRISSNATSPAVLGLWRPTILLPSTARGWDADRRRAVLLHELAHIDRGDLRVQALAQAACALYWFNPLIWIAVAQLRSECEKACDDAVLRNGAMPSAYAAHLLDIARELSPSLRPSHALAMARPSQLEGRLLAVLAAKQARIPWRGSRWTVATAAVVATVAVLGASPSDGQQPLTIDAAAPVRRITVEAMQSPNLGERFAAARALARAAKRLETAVDSQDRERAALELIESEERVGVTPFEAALNDPDQDVREKAALGLALASSPDAIPGLLKALQDPDAQVREKAAMGLALRRDPRVVPALIAAMSDRDAQVREKAAISLGTSGDPRAAAVLERALEDPDGQVREQAAAGLVLLQSRPRD